MSSCSTDRSLLSCGTARQRAEVGTADVVEQLDFLRRIVPARHAGPASEPLCLLLELDVPIC